MVSRFHGNRDIGDFTIYLLFRPRQGFVRKYYLPVPFIRLEVGGAVLADKPSKPFSHIQQTELCK